MNSLMKEMTSFSFTKRAALMPGSNLILLKGSKIILKIARRVKMLCKTAPQDRMINGVIDMYLHYVSNSPCLCMCLNAKKFTVYICSDF